MPVVKRPLHRRVERRWRDYDLILMAGTEPSVGSPEPRLADHRREVPGFQEAAGEEQLRAADAALDRIWSEDQGNWQRRLQPFLTRLDARSSRQFGRLVEAGCQPDHLAWLFHEATAIRQATKDGKRLRQEVEALDRLTTVALTALRTLRDRRVEFDRYTEAKRYRVLHNEPGLAELNIFCADFEDFTEIHRRELESYRRQLDGRRNVLAGHPRVRLSNHIRAITGGFKDPSVESILNSLLRSDGQRLLGPGTLKRQRARWSDQFRP